jgi:hypothetical protein
MVPSNGMYLIYIFNVQLKLTKIIAINYLFNIYYYVILKGPPWFYSKV